jgi:hypothetical protein
MPSFQISDAAKEQIIQIFESRRCTSPVARLCERADANELFDDIKDSLIHATNSDEDISIKVGERFREVEGKLKSFLTIDVLEESGHQGEDLVSVNGITFLMGDNAASLLNGCCLTFDGKNFFLIDSDNSLHTLRSLAEKKSSKEEPD